MAGWVRDSQDLPEIVGWTMVGVGMDAWQRVVDETLEYFWMKIGGHAQSRLVCLGLASPRFHKDVPVLFPSYVQSLGKI